MAAHCKTCNTTTEDCRGCRQLPGSIQCNHHRTEGSVDRMLRLADEAGLTLTATDRVARALEAEKALGFSGIAAN